MGIGALIGGNGAGGYPSSMDGLLFGNGSDGALDFDGATTILGIAPVANVYTCGRLLNATTIRVRSGVTLDLTRCGVICAIGAISGDDSTAIIRRVAPNGSNGTIGAGGAGAVISNIGAMPAFAQAGGDGGFGATPGTSTGAGGFTFADSLIKSDGGNGGAGTASAGGSSAATISRDVPGFAKANPITYCFPASGASAANQYSTSGSGGGGGAAAGGGGGGSAGAVLIIRAGGGLIGGITLQCLGGNGGNGFSNGAANGGGGGGGSGGLLVFLRKNGAPASYAWSAAGGTGGTAGGVGAANGSDGPSGAARILNYTV